MQLRELSMSVLEALKSLTLVAPCEDALIESAGVLCFLNHPVLAI